MPLKAHLQKSYICAYKTDKNHNFTAITSAKPTTSLRYYENKKECYKIYLTGSHNLAVKNNEKENFKKLQKNLPTKPNYIWSNKDIITNDYLPFIGELKPNLFIGTGYNTWGMTNGSLAGKILNDLAQNKENEYQELFSPKRSINLSKIINFPLNLVSNLKSFIENKIIKNKSWYKEKVKFKKINGQNVGIYIDKNHKKHIVYNLCPHLKCSLIFNEQEKTWDCPCHGSRFDIDGNCIEGPSNYNITYKK